MSHHRITSSKRLFSGMIAIAIMGMGSIAIAEAQVGDATQPGAGAAEPMARLPGAVVKGLTAKGVSNLALLDHDGAIKQVLALSSNGTAEVNLSPPEPSQTADPGAAPETQPLVPLPPNLVKGLTERAIWNLALLDGSGGIMQVLALFPDGRCEACEKIQGSASRNVRVVAHDGIQLLDFAIGTAKAAHTCPKDCFCSGGNCRNKLGSCCPC